jgi:4-coumarate--CoA ligase
MNKSSYDPETKIWRGPKVLPIYNTNVSLGHLILEIFAKNSQFIGQINADTGKETTYYELRVTTIRIANSLANMGYKKGDSVSIMATNSEYLAPLTFALFVLGLPVNFLSPTFNKADIVHMLGIIQPKLIFCDSEFLDNIRSAMGELSLKSQVFTLLEEKEGCGFFEDLILETGTEDDYL